VNADLSPSPDVEAGRHRLASPLTAVLLGAPVLLLLAVAVPLIVLTGDYRKADDGLTLILILAILVVGVVVARHRPGNPIGWLAIAAAAVLTITNVAGLYAVLDYHHRQGGLPLGRADLFVADTVWPLAFVLVPLPILLFPEGRLPSPRWRWVLGAYLVAGGATLAAGVAQEVPVLTHPIHVDAVTGQSTGSYHLTGALDWISTVGTAATLGVPAGWLLFVGRQVVAWRQAGGERRQQLKWLASGGAIAVVSGLATYLATALLTGTLQHVLQDIAVVGIAALPVSIGVAVLRYRLYEIDRLISRTISYAIITGLLAGVFLAIVALATDVLPFSSPVGVAASTLAAAALFNPLRKRVQHIVDRRFNRARYDADAIVSAFTLQLRDAVDLDTVRGELLRAVDRAVEPRHASLWIKPIPGSTVSRPG
jgi:hypothetical protein